MKDKPIPAYQQAYYFYQWYHELDSKQREKYLPLVDEYYRPIASFRRKRKKPTDN